MAPPPPKLIPKGNCGISIWVHVLLDKYASYRPTQSHFGPQASGVLEVDRYSGCKAMAQVKSGRMVLAFCWAHVRRDFVRVGKGWPELTPPQGSGEPRSALDGTHSLRR